MTTCVICLEEIQNESMTKLQCNHSFHLECYLENVIKSDNSNNCAVCRSNVNVNILDEMQNKKNSDMKKFTEQSDRIFALEQTVRNLYIRIQELNTEKRRIVAHNKELQKEVDDQNLLLDTQTKEIKYYRESNCNLNYDNILLKNNFEIVSNKNFELNEFNKELQRQLLENKDKHYDELVNKNLELSELNRKLQHKLLNDRRTRRKSNKGFYKYKKNVTNN